MTGPTQQTASPDAQTRPAGSTTPSTVLDYTTLFEPQLRLTLEHESSGNYIVVHDDTPGSLASHDAAVYMRSPDLDLCARFMLAMQAKKQAEIDEDSIIWFRLLKTSGHSIRVPTVEEVESGLPRGTDGGSTSSNVVPIRRGA